MRKWFAVLSVISCIGAAWGDGGGRRSDRPTTGETVEGGGQGADRPTAGATVEGGGLVEEKGYDAWHLRIGPVMAPRVRTSIRGPRVVLPSVPRNGSTTGGSYGNAPASPSAGYVRRDYVDGRVYPDAGTEDPGTMIHGLTWDWGADNVPAQYSGGRMEFHTDATRWSESYSSSSFAEGGEGDDSSDILLGFEAMGGWTFWNNRLFDAAIDVGFRYYGSDDVSANSRYGTSVTTTRDEFRIVDSYDASGWTTVPGGAYEGTAGGPGRLLGALPDRREEQIGSAQSSRSSYASNRSKLDYTIWDLRLGPTLGWQATDWLAFRGGVYGLLGLVNGHLKSDTVTSGGSYHADTSKCTPLFGMAFGLSAQANLTDWLFLYGGIEYDWWTDKVAMDAGGAHATLEMSDFSVSAGIGFEF